MPPAAQAAAVCSGDSLGVGNSAHMAAISCPGSSAMLGAGDSVVVSPGQGLEVKWWIESPKHKAVFKNYNVDSNNVDRNTSRKYNT